MIPAPRPANPPAMTTVIPNAFRYLLIVFLLREILKSDHIQDSQYEGSPEYRNNLRMPHFEDKQSSHPENASDQQERRFQISTHCLPPSGNSQERPYTGFPI